VRLRNAYVINATTFDTDFDGNITTVYATYDPNTLGKNPEKKISRLPISSFCG
jgi:glutaminyl-tRNA synthetase